VKATSLWQPWASGIALGHKRIETRHWITNHRGEIAIHAAKRWDAEQRDYAEDFRRRGWIDFGLPFGAVVAVACIADVKRTEMLIGSIDKKEEAFGNYGPRRFGWILEDIRPLATPVPCKGAQGIFNLPPDVEQAVRDQLGHV